MAKNKRLQKRIKNTVSTQNIKLFTMHTKIGMVFNAKCLHRRQNDTVDRAEI